MIESMDDLHAIGWRDFISFAWNEPDMRRGFEKDTGHKLAPPARPGSLEAMIDKATGKDVDDVTSFMAWATDRWYGWDHVPEKARIELQAVLDKKGWRRDVEAS